MAYCSQCGAYLAEGFEKCPACGASARGPDRKRRDDSWDIYEDNGYKGGAAAYKRERAYREDNARDEFDPNEWRGGDGPFDGRVIYDVVPLEDRIFAALSYCSWLFLVPLLARRQDPYVRFHLNQGLVLFVAGLLLSWMGILGALLSWAVFGLTVWGFVSAISGKETKLPLVGDIKILK